MLIGKVPIELLSALILGAGFVEMVYLHYAKITRTIDGMPVKS
jgi:hypothetical protein